MNKIDSIIFGILFPAAFLSTYEIIYHFSFLPSPTSSILSQLGADLRYLATEGVVILPLILLRKSLVFRRISGALLIIFGAIWIVWLLYGFPQYYISGMPYPPVLKTSDPWHTSLFYNFGSKTVLAVFFASILKMSYAKELGNLITRKKCMMHFSFLLSHDRQS
jgi:hypothetical protein